MNPEVRVSCPALVRWGSASAWFSDARDADAIADVLRRGTDTVTVTVVDFTPGEAADAIERRDELDEAINKAIDALDVGDGAVGASAISAALTALREVRP